MKFYIAEEIRPIVREIRLIAGSTEMSGGGNT